MRISDWSSDVCSSDLRGHRQRLARPHLAVGVEQLRRHRLLEPVDAEVGDAVAERDRLEGVVAVVGVDHQPCLRADGRAHRGDQLLDGLAAEGVHDLRSEEHTSELQSLMRISYAVFCLKKKKKHKTYT